MRGAVADLAVIIPALNEADNLPAMLESLAECRELIDEIIIADGGSTDDTVKVARAAGARVVTARRGRGAQLAAGAAASTAPWLLLLHADTRLAPGAAGALRAAMRDGRGRARYGHLRFASADPRARLLEFGVALRCALFRLPYGDQGLLIPRALLDDIGGVPDLPLMEDVALARRLGRRHLAPMRLTAITDASAYERDGWLRRAAANLCCLVRFRLGAAPEALAARYRR